MLTFDEDQIIEVMRLVVARRRKAQERDEKDTANDFGGLTAASETEKNRPTVCSHDVAFLAEGEPTVNSQIAE